MNVEERDGVGHILSEMIRRGLITQEPWIEVYLACDICEALVEAESCGILCGVCGMEVTDHNPFGLDEGAN